ncbi:protein of unknown function [Geodermatophilus telluris]|uniref:DUF1707 domain-containing protein n=1 Tax=Geodermatophilus telluris TaxID=1190417 RepID=A0A1G6U931_9ACTN|nr:DUF1707 domain-containing protein [Geodermatophilus telluris]SDD37789.1 protein of unknown function [Geodermatophilus telluris]
MPEPHLRAADADRAAAVTRLDQGLTDGRLTLAEYEDRAARAHTARTYGELAELTADLPRPADRPRPVARAVYGGPWHGAWGHDLRAAWAGWATTAVVVVAVWLVSVVATGDLRYPWPVWVVGPWAVALVARTIGARRRGQPGT